MPDGPTLPYCHLAGTPSEVCNDYEQQIQEALRMLDLGMPTTQSKRDLPRADDIRDQRPVMRAAGN